MRTFTIKDIRAWVYFYGPLESMPENWSGTVIDLLNIEDIPISYRFWIVMRKELLSDRLMRLFEIWSARQVQDLMEDPRLVRAIKVSERFANHEATKGELDQAIDEALDVEKEVIRNVKYWDNKSNAVWMASISAVKAVISGYGHGVGMDASWYSSRAQEFDASDNTVFETSREVQKNKLIEMILAEER